MGHQRDCQLLFEDRQFTVFLKRTKLLIFKGASKQEVLLPSKLRGLMRIGLFRRLLRYEIRCFSRLGSKFFFFLKGSLYSADDSGKLSLIRSFSRMSSPLYFCLDRDQSSILFGDYSNDGVKEPVNVYRLYEDGHIDIIASFPAGTVKHIHNIIPAESGKFYVLTGDSDQESGIWVLEGNAISPLLVGDQAYRSCYLVSQGAKVVFLTDTPMTQNYIRELDLTSGKVRDLIPINGPVINAVCDSDSIYFATSVEPNPEMKKLFNSYVVSRSIYDKYIHIFRFQISTSTLTELYKYKKDHHNMHLFGLGNARLFLSEGILSVVPLGNGKLYGKTLSFEVPK